MTIYFSSTIWMYNCNVPLVVILFKCHAWAFGGVFWPSKLIGMTFNLVHHALLPLYNIYINVHRIENSTNSILLLHHTKKPTNLSGSYLIPLKSSRSLNHSCITFDAHSHDHLSFIGYCYLSRHFSQTGASDAILL